MGQRGFSWQTSGLQAMPVCFCLLYSIVLVIPLLWGKSLDCLCCVSLSVRVMSHPCMPQHLHNNAWMFGFCLPSMAKYFRNNFINPHIYSRGIAKLIFCWDFTVTHEKAVKLKQKNLSTEIRVSPRVLPASPPPPAFLTPACLQVFSFPLPLPFPISLSLSFWDRVSASLRCVHL